MKQFKELSKIVTDNKAKRVSFIDDKTEKSPYDYVKMAAGIASDKIKSEEDIAGMISADKKSVKYRVFKFRFMERLLNSMLVLDMDKHIPTNYARALKTCGRNHYCINLLIMFSASTAATILAKSTLKLALDYELYDTALFCAVVLRKQFSYRGDKEAYHHYNDLVEKYHHFTYAEDKTAGYLEGLYVIQANTNIFKPETLELAKDYLSRAEGIFKACSTYQNGVRYFRIKAIYECLGHDYETALDTWAAFDVFLGKYKNYEEQVRMGESTLQQLYCHLCQGNYHEGKACAVKCEKLFALHSNNWFIYKEYYFLLSMHTRNYDETSATLHLIHSIPQFKLLNPNRREKWKIFEAYNSIVQLGMARAAGINDASTTKFKLSKFLNEILTFSKDKEGYNTAVLIIQIMILLLNKKFNLLPDRAEALKRYANRYFKKEEVYKSHTFMKMLVLADQSNYDKSLTIQKTARLADELKRRRYTYANTYDGIEIVPYADLWEIVLECLS